MQMRLAGSCDMLSRARNAHESASTGGLPFGRIARVAHLSGNFVTPYLGQDKICDSPPFVASSPGLSNSFALDFFIWRWHVRRIEHLR